jgi:hypothetical protein
MSETKTSEAEERWGDACSLPRDERGARGAAIRADLLGHVQQERELPDGHAWAFAGTAELRAKLEHWIEAERVCCSGLDFGLSEDGEHLWLEVTGQGPARWAHAKSWRRVLRAGGSGVVGAWLLLCGVPMALSAIVGTAAVAPLARLDHPLALSLAALAIAGAVWGVGRRRSLV